MTQPIEQQIKTAFAEDPPPQTAFKSKEEWLICWLYSCVETAVIILENSSGRTSTELFKTIANLSDEYVEEIQGDRESIDQVYGKVELLNQANKIIARKRYQRIQETIGDPAA